MANHSKRYPWVVQLFSKTVGMWFDLSAFRTEVEAEDRIGICRKRQPETEWRIVSYVVAGAEQAERAAKHRRNSRAAGRR